MSHDRQTHARARRAMTLVEIMVSIAIFLSLITIASMVHHNVSKSIGRTLALLQIHHEGNAIIRRLREDLGELAPQVAMKLADHHLTFMRSHGEALAQERRHSGYASGAYAHDLYWVRWYWKNGELRRAATPRIRTTFKGANNDDHENSMGGSVQSGIVPAPQQFYHYFQPSTMPDDHLAADYQTQIASLESGLREFGGFALSTDIYYRPAKLWWHPGHEKAHNRGEPGSTMKVYAGSITEETGSDPITAISFKTTTPVGSDDPMQIGFSVVNSSGYSTNRDYLNLLGSHPEHPHATFAGHLGLVSGQVLNLRILLFEHEWTGNTIDTDGNRKTRLFAFEEAPATALSPGAFAGMPMGPSAANPLSGTTFEQRPVRAEISFVVHNVPMSEMDIDDLDGDGDVDERLSAVLADLHPDDDDALILALEDLGYIGVPFHLAVTLPN